MLDTKQFISAIKQIADEKGIPEDKIIETIELAIAAAHKRDYGGKGQIIKAKLNRETGGFSMTQTKYVIEGVDGDGFVIGEVPGSVGGPGEGKREFSRKSGYVKITDHGGGDGDKRDGSAENEDETRVKFNPERYITLEEAKKIDKKLKIGDEIVTKLESKSDFGRIAAQTAKQVIIQRLREIERDVIFNEFKDKEGSVISGIVQRREGSTVYVDLGRTNGILPFSEQIPQDGYRSGQRLKFIIYKVEDTPKGPAVILSRTLPSLVTRLFEFEVPEIEAKTVEIKAVAREAGSRSKIAVFSSQSGIDPIGSLVGQRGVRVQTVINELSGEKIDIIKWDEDAQKLISNALSPAKILDVKILDEKRKHALVEVADDQFSLAIGKRGQNVRLAAKLTGWKIDVRSPKSSISLEEAENEEQLEIGDERKNSEEPAND